jgi:hypothetical protein
MVFIFYMFKTTVGLLYNHQVGYIVKKSFFLYNFYIYLFCKRRDYIEEFYKM